MERPLRAVRPQAPDAEYADENGSIRAGRAAIRETVAASFKAHPGARLEATSDGLRILSATSAVEDGTSTVRSAEGEIPSRSRYTILYTRNEGRWLIASLRDYPPQDGIARERMEALAWMVGDWMQDTDAASVRSTCRWSDDGPWLIQSFTIDNREGEVGRSTQRIGWDPLTKKFRSWFWDDDGGYAEALWTGTGNSWILQSRGVTATGVVATAQFRITRDGEDAFRWESMGQTVGEGLIPDRTFLIVRTPPQPKGGVR